MYVCTYVRVCVNKCVLLYTRAAYGTRVYVRLCARKNTPYIHTHLPCTQHRAACLAIQYVEERFVDLAAVGLVAFSIAQQLGQQPSCINVRCIPVQTRHTHVQGMCEVARAREKEFVKLLACRWLHPSTRVRHV